MTKLIVATGAIVAAAWVAWSVARPTVAGAPPAGPGTTPTTTPATQAAASQPTKETDVKLEKATFAAGCFWGVQSRFDAVKGVVSTTVGYTGGHTDKPTYREVCGDQTGHAEAIEISFEPNVVTYDQLLDVFFNGHDPTTVNRQGPDVGTQYRSVIFYHSAEQEKAAKAAIERLGKSGKFKRPIATEVVAATTFFPAEEYHQKYLAKRGQSSCGVGGHP